jgi:hypothetical protein
MGQPLNWWVEFYSRTIWQSCGGDMSLEEINGILEHLITQVSIPGNLENVKGGE